MPADILDAIDAWIEPMFVEYETAAVDAERLDEMIAALEARSFTIIRE
jgi:hypothetical protein